MVIQHNISAMNSHRMMGINNGNTSNNLAKLSSGYKINKAGDDAAGLAISEKMRGQIRGLAMAEQNASNGISLIQTAEGGLQETHAILQRMREMAVQSANGTYQNDVDRENLEKEFQALKEEVDRISEYTNYNGIKLLDGSLGGAGKAASVVLGEDIKPNALGATVDATKGFTELACASFAGASGVTASAANVAYEAEMTVSYKDTDGEVKSVTVKISDIDDKDASGTKGIYDYSSSVNVINSFLAELKGNSELADKFDIALSGDNIVFTAKDGGQDGPLVVGTQVRKTLDGATSTANGTMSTVALTTSAGVDSYNVLDFNMAGNCFDLTDPRKSSFEINGTTFVLVTSNDALANLGKDVVGIKVSNADPNSWNPADLELIAATITKETGLEVIGGQTKGAASGITSLAGAALTGKIAIFGLDGSTGGEFGKGLTFQIGANGTEDQRVTLKVNDMSAKGIGITNTSIADRDIANTSIEVLENAINTVSGTRADLGALQNRLEHTLNNLGVTKENLQAAESSIRDVDMAKEMMEFTKNNILVQASQAMLAQANQLPQGVLQLLR